MTSVPGTNLLPKQPVLEIASLRQRPAELPSLLDLPYGVLTNSGRSAILMALQLLRIGRGDGVLVPTYHCPTMIAPVERAGGVPVFYPITASGSPDMTYLEQRTMRPVRAMLVAHMFGLPIPLEHVSAFCRSRDIALIEDCAHCFFGFAGTRAIGTTGDFAIGSLPKFFPVLEGGVLASATRSVPTWPRRRPARDEFRAAWDILDLSSGAGRLGVLGTCLRTASRTRRAMRHKRDEGHPAITAPSAEFIRDEALRDPLLQPAPARRVEARLITKTDFAQNVERRRAIFASYVHHLAGMRDATPLVLECGKTSAPYVLPLLVTDPDERYARMRAEGLPVFRWDRLWPGTPKLPNDSALTWARGVIQIACHQSLRDADVVEISRRVHACIAR